MHSKQISKKEAWNANIINSDVIANFTLTDEIANKDQFGRIVTDDVNSSATFWLLEVMTG